MNEILKDEQIKIIKKKKNKNYNDNNKKIARKQRKKGQTEDIWRKGFGTRKTPNTVKLQENGFFCLSRTLNQ